MPDSPTHDTTPTPDPAARPSAPPARQQAPVPAGYPPVPPPYPPMAPPKKQSGFKHGFGLGAGIGLGFGAAMVVLSVVSSVLAIIAMMAFGAMAGSLVSATPGSMETLSTVWGPESATGKLRSIPVRGAIQTSGTDGLFASSGVYGYEVADVIDGLDAKDADALVLMLDTPGGSVTGSRAMADAVDRYRERTGKKVFAFVESMSASGGMYTMAGADEIVADHGSIVGSVGVIMGPIERYRDVTSMGSLLTGSVTAREITSEYLTAGKHKDAGTPFRDLTPAERDELTSIITAMYDDFVTHVATKRDIPRETIVNELGAQIFTGARAQEVGYIDATMGRDEAMRHFAAAAGLDPAQTKVVESVGPASWTSLFGLEQRPWGVSPAAKAEGGQPARVTAKLCTESRTPLLLHGALAASCA
ncbi:MAG: S49 family peptidase [Nigerium sp.]|nr:S49 family peptidase [Nigerium sp.]